MDSSVDRDRMMIAPEYPTRTVRERLLDGPVVDIVVLYSSDSVQQSHQLSAASKIVVPDRRRHFSEQVERLQQNQGDVSKAVIEFPVRALEAASDLFKQSTDKEPQLSKWVINIGTILPGYLMEVLDWYSNALRAKHWKRFLPKISSLEEDDKFYWLYIYVVMRKLGMHNFASELGSSSIQKLVKNHRLADDVWMLQFLLQYLSTDDPILAHIAERHVHLYNVGQCPLSPKQCDDICEDHPHFGVLVRNAHQLFQDTEDALMIMDSLSMETDPFTDEDEDEMKL